MDEYYDYLCEELVRLNKINPDFLEENGLPQRASEYKMLLKAKHGMEYGDKLRMVQSKISSARSDFEMADSQPAFKESGIFAEHIEEYVEFIKTTLGLN